MSEKVIPFSGGEKERLDRQLAALGHDPEFFDFDTTEGLSIHAVVEHWGQVISQYEITSMPVSAVIEEYDGVGMVVGAAIEQVREALIYHLGQIQALPTRESVQEYWFTHPIIKTYIERVQQESLK